MKTVPSRIYLPQQAVYPAMGLDTQRPATQLDPTYSPNCLNVNFRRGDIRKRSGYTQLGATLPDPIMAVITFEIATDNVKTVVITTKKQYEYKDGSFVNLTTQSGGVDQNWTGNEDNYVDWVVGVDTTGVWLFVTNGVDAPRKWDGQSSRFVPHGLTLDGFVSCKSLAIYKGSLVLGGMVYVGAGGADSKTVAISAPGLFTDFTSVTSDEQILEDASGQIYRMLPLADSLIIYTSNSIINMTFVGGQTTWSFVKVVDNTRFLGPGAVANLGLFHSYMSEENIYFFDGSRQIRPLGNSVQRTYRLDLDLQNAKKCFVFYDGIETTLVFVVSVRGGTKVYLCELSLLEFYNPQVNRWWVWSFADDPKVFAYYRRDSTLTWDKLVGSWDTQVFKWSDVDLSVSFPQLCFSSGNKIFVLSSSAKSDNGSDIESFVETVDFTLPQDSVSQFCRLLEVETELSGTRVLVEYSSDQGMSWNKFQGSNVGLDNDGSQRLNSDMVLYKFYADASSRTFRLRFSCPQNDTFERRWLKLWVKPAGAW